MSYERAFSSAFVKRRLVNGFVNERYDGRVGVRNFGWGLVYLGLLIVTKAGIVVGGEVAWGMVGLVLVLVGAVLTRWKR